MKKIFTKKIPLFIASLFLILAIVGLSLSNNIIKIFSNKQIKNSIVFKEQDQADYLQIEKGTIELNRTTGSEPFLENSDSNYEISDGFDPSNDDEYVRTLDSINYNVKFQIKKTGDTDYEYEAAKIKIRATLPKEKDTGKVLITWEPSSWMKENYTLNEDKTEIIVFYELTKSEDTLEFNLPFIAMVGGYKGTFPENEYPTFEILVEGNPINNTVISEEDINKIEDKEDIVISARPTTYYIN